jgi:hypothetical protein
MSERKLDPPLPAETPEERIAKWAESSGHTLEMRTARILREAGFSTVIQGQHYTDPTTSEQRETDVVASHSIGSSGKQVIVELVCECKHTTDKLTVMLTHPLNVAPSLVIRRRAHTKHSKALLLELGTRPELQSLSISVIPNEPGYRMAFVSKSDRDDQAHKALLSLGSACRGIVDDIARVAPGVHVIAIPLLILSGKLFEARLNQNGAINVIEVDQSVLAWRNPIIDRHSYIAVVTESGLKQAASRLASEAKTLAEAALALVLKQMEKGDAHT